MEKEVSGLYLSGHPLDAYRENIKNISSCKINELTGEQAKDYDSKVVRIVCAVVKTRMMTTRSNTMMAFTTVEDLTGSMELLVFPRVLAECRAALVDNSVVVVTGRVSVKEDEAAKLIVEQIVPIEAYSPAGEAPPRKSEAPMALYLKMPGRDCPQMHKVQNLLSIFDGGMPVYMYFTDTRQLAIAPRTMWALDHPLLRQELERILGQGNVAVQAARGHKKA